ncbi:hypothetical protein V5799_006584 [Amblyomma americanum]|uniref:Secreted protein n=1 Tax=Amblyomma americanum TaxID=6943 RepID=A0AAQ4DVZ8_AMBAM
MKSFVLILLVAMVPIVLASKNGRCRVPPWAVETQGQGSSTEAQGQSGQQSQSGQGASSGQTSNGSSMDEMTGGENTRDEQ